MQNDAVYGWENEQAKELFSAILKLKTVKECEDFFRDLMTLHEIEEMTSRFQMAKMLDRKASNSLVDRGGKRSANGVLSFILSLKGHGSLSQRLWEDSR